MDWLPQPVVEFLIGVGIPLAQALVTLFAFSVGGFMLTWRNPRQFEPGNALQFVLVTTTIRIVSSYLMFHQPLREGLWPLAWSLGCVFGMWVGRRATPPPRLFQE